MRLHRRHAGPVCIAAALLMLALVCRPSRTDSRPRHLVLITLDTMRADRLPAYGFSGVDTPALDGLAADGVVFEETLAPVPLTLPSHASLFTGLYPPRHGVRDNVSPPLADGFETLAERLRARGLRTAAFVASAVVAPGRGVDQGFDHYSLGEPSRCAGAPRTRRRAGEVVDEVLSWLGRHDAEPFFVWLHLFDTHRPYDRSDNPDVKYLDPYLEAIAYEDSQIARLGDYLDTRGLLDATLIVVVGDHGESLGDHGEDGHGIFLYQEALRVPFIVRGPGVNHHRVKSVVRLIDVMPTILDLFGVPASGIDGVSLAQVATGTGSAPPLDVYSESMYPRRFGWAPLRALRADRYKLIDAPRPELYDLATDPGELRNVHASHATVASAMRDRLRSYDSQQEHTSHSSGEMDQAMLDRIASLGYVGNIAAPKRTLPSSQPDPKDRIADFNTRTIQHWENTERARLLCR